MTGEHGSFTCAHDMFTAEESLAAHTIHDYCAVEACACVSLCDEVELPVHVSTMIQFRCINEGAWEHVIGISVPGAQVLNSDRGRPSLMPRRSGKCQVRVDCFDIWEKRKRL